MSEDIRTTAQHIADIENKLQGAEKAKRILAKWEKLESNREFRELIIESFCGTEAARYVQASAFPSLTDRDRANALALAQASGHLLEFISVQKRMAEQAINQIPSWLEDLEALQEMQRQEQIEEDR